MRNRKILTTLILILTATVWVKNATVDETAPLKVSRINANTLQISGAENAAYSPSGKFLAVKGASKFLLLATQNLNDSIENVKERDGNFIGFLPSDALIYTAGGEIFALEPQKQIARKLFSAKLAKELIEPTGGQSDVVIVSNDLIVAGSGSYDWGGDMGNIFRYDLKTNRVTKGAKVWAFWYASLSPSHRYILYEHGAENNNDADLYDVSLNKNYPLDLYFNFKRAFPKLKSTDEAPIAWLAGQDKFLAEIMPPDDEDSTETNGWIVLFDVPARKIIWKKQVSKWLFPADFQQIDANRALLAYDDGVYELSLKTGAIRKNTKIDGKPVAASPNGKKIAFIKSGKVYTALPDGSNKKQIFEFPDGWKMQTAYKGMGERSPLWSAGGDWLILFGENQMLLVQP